MRVVRRLAGLVAAAALILPAAAQAHRYHCTHPSTQVHAAGGLQLTQVAFIGQMTGIVSVPSQPNRIYVAERGGRVDIVENGTVRKFLDIASQTESTIDLAGNERGMWSVAFAPDYARSRKLYVSFNDLNGDTRVVEFRANPDFESVDMSTERTILFVEHSFSARHYAGQLAFGPGHRLFISLGDAEHPKLAQEKKLYGEIVSLKPAHPKKTLKVIAKGMRNPYHFTFDPFTGSIVVGDVGEASTEEIDVLRRRLWGKANLGWPYFEGHRRVFPGKVKHYLRPSITYNHHVGTAIMGGVFMRDPRLPQLRGRYMYADFCDAWIAAARLHGKHPTSRHTGLVIYAPTAFGTDQAHEVYVAASSGQLYRIDPAPSSAARRR